MRKYRRALARSLMRREGYAHVNRWMSRDWRRILEMKDKILQKKRHKKLRRMRTT